LNASDFWLMADSPSPVSFTAQLSIIKTIQAGESPHLLAFPKESNVGGVSDADFLFIHNMLCNSDKNRGRRPLPQLVLGKAVKGGALEDAHNPIHGG
jgi:hypothetical protein